MKHIVLIIILTAYGLTSHAFAEQEVLKVDLGEVIQENFLGVNAVHHGFSFLPESVEQGMDEASRRIDFQRLKQSGMHLVRTFYRPDWAMGQGPWSVPDWESTKMKALYRWLAEMQNNDIDVALNVGWWFGRDVIWKKDQHLASYPDDMQRYAQWVSQSLHQIIELRGFRNVKYIFMFTEPAGEYGDIPYGKSGWEYYREVVLATHKRLQKDGRRNLVKIVAPNTTQAPKWLAQTANDLAEVVDVMASHNYNYTTYQQWFDMAMEVKKAAGIVGKPFWIDEYGVQNFTLRKSFMYGHILALANAAFLNAGAQTSLLWIFSDQYYPFPIKYLTNGDAFQDGLHQWGLYPWTPVSQEVRPAWYAFALMSRLMGGPGTKVFQTQGVPGFQLAATRDNADNVSILVINEGDEKRDISIQFTKKIAAPFYRYLYAPFKETEGKRGMLPSGKKFVGGELILHDGLPAKGVAIYSNVLLAQESQVGEDQTAEDNVAFGKKVVASSSATGFMPEQVVDGSRLYYWSSLKKKTPAPENVMVDLGENYHLTKIMLYPKSGTDEAAYRFPLKISVSISCDQKKWKQVAFEEYLTDVDPTVKVFSFGPSLARYVRVTGQRLRSDKDGIFVMQLAEIKVFAKQ